MYRSKRRGGGSYSFYGDNTVPAVAGNAAS